MKTPLHTNILAGLVCALFGTQEALAQPFTELNPALPQTPRPCVVWGDYDADGDLDVLVAGEGKQNSVITTIYNNHQGSFTNSGVALTGLSFAAAAWADFDRDGDLDLAMTGELATGGTRTMVYRNNGGTFAPASGTFIGVMAGNVAWGDYDNDGDLDLLVTGIVSTSPGSAASTRLYRNDPAGFVSVAHPFPNIYLGAAEWGDYDNDGDLDLVLAGTSAAAGLNSTIWRNQGGGVFVDAGANLPAANIGFATWGDYDTDGDLDLLFGGDSTAGWISRIYRNDAGTFTDIQAGMTGLIWSAAAWGDSDNDGDLDAITIGYEPVNATNHTILYRNDGGQFLALAQVFRPAYLGTVSWANYDNDGDQDLLVAGNQGANQGDFLRIYRNGAAISNTPPAAPTSLSAICTGPSATLSWSPSSDNETPVAGITYNLRVGTTPGGSEVLTAQSTSNGFRQLPVPGNCRHRLTATLGNLAAGRQYFWSVQAVDSAMAGSPFALEQSFTMLGEPPVFVGVVRTNQELRFAWRGTPAVAYRVEGSTNFAAWKLLRAYQADTNGFFEHSEDPAVRPGYFLRAAAEAP